MCSILVSLGLPYSPSPPPDSPPPPSAGGGGGAATGGGGAYMGCGGGLKNCKTGHWLLWLINISKDYYRINCNCSKQYFCHHEVDESQEDQPDDAHHDHRLEVLHKELVLERPCALLELCAAVLQRVRPLLQRREFRVAFKTACSKGMNKKRCALGCVNWGKR